eukprot:SAG31_NODE_3732_length_3940_cov_35.007550_2_plen_166_part_00
MPLNSFVAVFCAHPGAISSICSSGLLSRLEGSMLTPSRCALAVVVGAETASSRARTIDSRSHDDSNDGQNILTMTPAATATPAPRPAYQKKASCPGTRKIHGAVAQQRSSASVIHCWPQKYFDALQWFKPNVKNSVRVCSLGFAVFSSAARKAMINKALHSGERT